MVAFSTPPRHAPGFPVGCVDAGDAFAVLSGSAFTVLVVTSALRDAIEASGDPALGLARVRRSLARAGATFVSPWHVGYYGKDLAAVLPGVANDLAAAGGIRAESAAAEGIRHGWAWKAVVAPTDDREEVRSALLAACYQASVAARIRRDHLAIRAFEANEVLEEWREMLGEALGESQVASMLAAVVVRPYGGDAHPSAAPGEDPRWPGVRSMDQYPESLRTRSAYPAGDAFYIVSDVHDIEWGFPVHSRSSASTAHNQRCAREGNTARLIPLARTWLSLALSTDELTLRAYRERLGREQILARHLRRLVEQPGELFGTLGDGIEGVAERRRSLVDALAEANRKWRGQIQSGIGAAKLSGLGENLASDVGCIAYEGSEEPIAYGLARQQARFSLHVTKTLKATDSRLGRLHFFGEQLSPAEAAEATQFLRQSRTNNSTVAPHHLEYARRNLATWIRHLPAVAHAAFEMAVSSTVASDSNDAI